MGAYYELKLLLNKVLKRLDTLQSAVSSIAQDVKMPRGKVQTVCISTSIDLTLQTLRKSSEPRSAAEIATVTGRARAVESMHLNELYRNGLVGKKKRGKECVFTLRERKYD